MSAARTAGAARPRNQPVDGQRWKLRFDTVDAEFTAGKTRAKIHGHDADFPAPFLIENSRGLVPLSALRRCCRAFWEGT